MMIANLIWRIRELAADRRGATAIEYAILAALIAGVVVVAVRNLGSALSGVFNNIANNVNF